MSKEYTNTFLTISELAHEKGHHFHITTLTCMLKIHQCVDIEAIYTSFEEEGITLRLSRNKNDFYYTKRKKLTKVFYNQLSFIFNDYSKKAVKLFSNGNIQMTGLASLYDFESTKETLMNWLHKYTKVIYTIVPESEKIPMVNAHFRIANHIKLLSYISCMKQKDNSGILKIKYKPERYPAINVKMKNKTSIFIFRTGNIIMSSCSIDAILDTYRQFDFESISQPIKVYPTKHLLHGYDLKTFTNCIYNS